MIKEFREFIEQESLCSKDDSILVAVSGGLDSMVLLDLFHKTGNRLFIAHCNFKLRDIESDEDEEFVKRICSEKKLEFVTNSFDTQGYADQMNCSIQEAARELRYKWFNELCLGKDLQKIAIAHHIDDQTETFFINLFRGSGIRGLKGMPVKRAKIIRPLMFANRKDIIEYAKKEQLEYREDSSNASDKYLRNKIRHKLIPLLNDIGPATGDTLTKSIEYLNEDYKDFQQLIDQLRNRLTQKGPADKINLTDLRELNDSLAYQVLRAYHFKREATDNIMEVIHKGKTGKIFYSTSHKALIDREYLIIEVIGTEMPVNEYFIENDAEFILEPVHLSFERIQYDSSLHIVTNPGYAYLDVEKLSFPLKIRKWSAGDRFVPFGMSGSKLVSDFLVDQKVSRFDKEKVWVLQSGDEIAWIIGFRISELFRVNKNTRNCLKIVAKKLISS